jgi:putative transposase
MKKTRYTEEQIAFALRQAEGGTPVSEVIRKMGITEPDPPPLKWSTLKYVLRLTGGPKCRRSVTSRKRLSPSYARLM